MQASGITTIRFELKQREYIFYTMIFYSFQKFKGIGRGDAYYQRQCNRNIKKNQEINKQIIHFRELE